jgi:hypothetical protein
MTVLLLSFGAAGILVLFLILLLRRNVAGAAPAVSVPAVRYLPEPSPLNAAAINRAIFSERDWSFIQSQHCPALEALFREERKAIAALWLSDTSARISEIRKDHLQKSRVAQDLSPAKEFALLLRFVYLSAGCRLGILLVHLAGPSAPARLAAHIQQLFDTLPAVGEGTLPRVQEN